MNTKSYLLWGCSQFSAGIINGCQGNKKENNRFSSDNSPVINDGYYDDTVEKLGNHKPWGPLRGGKYSLFEAGTHMPFITFGKGTIEPSASEAMGSQLDLFSSLAQLELK